MWREGYEYKKACSELKILISKNMNPQERETVQKESQDLNAGAVLSSELRRELKWGCPASLKLDRKPRGKRAERKRGIALNLWRYSKYHGNKGHFRRRLWNGGLQRVK